MTREGGTIEWKSEGGVELAKRTELVEVLPEAESFPKAESEIEVEPEAELEMESELGVVSELENRVSPDKDSEPTSDDSSNPNDEGGVETDPDSSGGDTSDLSRSIACGGGTLTRKNSGLKIMTWKRPVDDGNPEILQHNKASNKKGVSRLVKKGQPKDADKSGDTPKSQGRKRKPLLEDQGSDMLPHKQPKGGVTGKDGQESSEESPDDRGGVSNDPPNPTHSSCCGDKLKKKKKPKNCKNTKEKHPTMTARPDKAELSARPHTRLQTTGNPNGRICWSL
ncbi:hypothetical protein JB92DRAFT_3129819 [Gautieria morchelliformis]|nr:hypothetical protein JB92DRAFT_3129819 [Gautieria morchelliformis]